ncbi:MAG: high-potential iron-sulfur protein [Chloroflexi bacterium]|nr:high-potential iron-sulfur protein [Chloroflexota bacterium]
MLTINHGRAGRAEQNSDLDTLIQQQYSRRNLLKRAALAGAVGVGLLSLAACGGESAKPATAAGGQTACATSGDPAADAGARKALKYVDQSADPTRICSGCRFYKQPDGGAACGGCQIITGPVAPTGYCSTWTAPS